MSSRASIEFLHMSHGNRKAALRRQRNRRITSTGIWTRDRVMLLGVAALMSVGGAAAINAMPAMASEPVDVELASYQPAQVKLSNQSVPSNLFVSQIRLLNPFTKEPLGITIDPAEAYSADGTSGGYTVIVNEGGDLWFEGSDGDWQGPFVEVYPSGGADVEMTPDGNAVLATATNGGETQYFRVVFQLVRANDVCDVVSSVTLNGHRYTGGDLAQAATDDGLVIDGEFGTLSSSNPNVVCDTGYISAYDDSQVSNGILLVNIYKIVGGGVDTENPVGTFKFLTSEAAGGGGGSTPLSSDATLSNLIVMGDAVSPSDAEKGKNLRVPLTHDEFESFSASDDIQFTTTQDDAKSMITTSSLVAGQKTVTIKVTAPDGVTVKTYEITVYDSEAEDDSLDLAKVTWYPEGATEPKDLAVGSVMNNVFTLTYKGSLVPNDDDFTIELVDPSSTCEVTHDDDFFYIKVTNTSGKSATYKIAYKVEGSESEDTTDETEATLTSLTFIDEDNPDTVITLDSDDLQKAMTEDGFDVMLGDEYPAGSRISWKIQRTAANHTPITETTSNGSTVIVVSKSEDGQHSVKYRINFIFESSQPDPTPGGDNENENENENQGGQQGGGSGNENKNENQNGGSEEPGDEDKHEGPVFAWVDGGGLPEYEGTRVDFHWSVSGLTDGAKVKTLHYCFDNGEWHDIEADASGQFENFSIPTSAKIVAGYVTDSLGAVSNIAYWDIDAHATTDGWLEEHADPLVTFFPNKDNPYDFGYTFQAYQGATVTKLMYCFDNGEWKTIENPSMGEDAEKMVIDPTADIVAVRVIDDMGGDAVYYYDIKNGVMTDGFKDPDAEDQRPSTGDEDEQQHVKPVAKFIEEDGMPKLTWTVDAETKVTEIHWRFDDGEWQSTTDVDDYVIDLPSGGAKKIEAYVTDGFGQDSNHVTYTFDDTEAPEPGGGNENENQNENQGTQPGGGNENQNQGGGNENGNSNENQGGGDEDAAPYLRIESTGDKRPDFTLHYPSDVTQIEYCFDNGEWHEIATDDSLVIPGTARIMGVKVRDADGFESRTVYWDIDGHKEVSGFDDGPSVVVSKPTITVVKTGDKRGDFKFVCEPGESGAACSYIQYKFDDDENWLTLPLPQDGKIAIPVDAETIQAYVVDVDGNQSETVTWNIEENDYDDPGAGQKPDKNENQNSNKPDGGNQNSNHNSGTNTNGSKPSNPGTNANKPSQGTNQNKPSGGDTNHGNGSDTSTGDNNGDGSSIINVDADGNGISGGSTVPVRDSMVVTGTKVVDDSQSDAAASDSIGSGGDGANVVSDGGAGSGSGYSDSPLTQTGVAANPFDAVIGVPIVAGIAGIFMSIYRKVRRK